MAARWFCSRDSKEIGPFAWQQVKQMADSGLIRPEDWLRTDVDPTWQPAQECPGLFSAPTEPPIADEAKLPVVAPPVQKRTAASAVPPVTPKTKSVQIPAGKPVAKAAIPQASIPQAKAIPSGTPAIPTGSAIPTGAAIPSGSALPAGAAIPSGVAMGSVPLGFATPSAAMPSSTAGPREKPKKKSGGGINMLVVGGGVAVVLVIVFVVVLMNAGPRSTTETQTAATTPTSNPTEPAAKPAEVEAAAAAALPKTEEKVEKATAKPANTRDPLVHAVKKWNDAAAGKVSLKAAGVEIEVQKLWFAADETGGEIEMSEEESTASSKPKFVCVQMKVDCANGNPPLAYSGWSKGAVLMDEEGNTTSPLETSATPSLHRIQKTTIRSGSGTEDVLVFPVDSSSMKLKLALPHKNLGIKSTGVFGFDLSRMHEKGMPVLTETVVSKDGKGEVKASEGTEKMPKKPLSEVDEVDAALKKNLKDMEEAEKAEAERKMKLKEEAMKKETPAEK